MNNRAMNKNNSSNICVQWVIAFVVALSVTACDVSQTTQPGQELADRNDTASETDRLNRWFAEQYDEELSRSPMTLTGLGSKKLYDQIDDFSEQAEQDMLQWRANTVAELTSNFDYSALTQDAKISYDLWVYRYEKAKAMEPFRRRSFIFTQMGGSHTQAPNFLINMHKVDELEDMQAYITRIGGISRAIDQLLERAKIHAQEGVRPPQFAYDGVIEDSKRLLAGAPFDNSTSADAPLWSDAQTKITALLEAEKIDQLQAEELRAAAQQALLEKFEPAYDALISWMETDKQNADLDARGASALPDGIDFYNASLADTTNTNLTAEEIHNIGLDEVARIRTEMDSIRQEVEFDGSLDDFFRFIETDPQFLYPNTDDGRQAYLDDATAFLEDMENRLPEYFGILPKAELEVKRVEAFREQAGSPQHYMAGAKDGSRPGVFYSHLSDMNSVPKNEVEAIAYHEGVPGHHMQVSIARELEDVPEFRTLGWSVSYGEGWALYAERLAKEMGAYQNSYTDLGRLVSEMWRAIRLVVDTGIHAQAWSEEQAINFFKENTPMAEGQIRAEVRRYFVWPSQATGYKIGMLKILELRDKAKGELGDKFDIRGFHDTVLGGGPVPLSILERQIDNWIEDVKSN
jgi:uncharacterized protein (DUF885 family)